MKNLFSCSLLFAAAILNAAIPQSITLKSGEVSVRLDGKKRWNMNRIEYQGELLCVDYPHAHYGMVCRPDKWKNGVGSGHDETGFAEQLVSLKIFADGKEVLPQKDITVQGKNIRVEKVSKILMPALFVMLVFMAIVSLTMPGAIEGLKFMFVPNFESIEANGGFLQMLSAATGQAFYSLSVGMGIAVTYGSYLKKDQSIPQNALSVCGLDTMVAIFSGLAVLPAIFAVGIAPSAGPGLVFISFPAVFESLGGFGVVAGILFFTLVLFAAWTSAISLLEVLISALEEKTKLSRKGATLVVAVVISITSILVAISMQPEGLFGVNLLDLFDSLTTYVMLPLTGLLMCFFLVKVIGMKAAKEELLLNCKVQKLGRVWEIAIKFIVPVLIAFILVMGILTWTGLI